MRVSALPARASGPPVPPPDSDDHTAAHRVTLGDASLRLARAAAAPPSAAGEAGQAPRPVPGAECHSARVPPDLRVRRGAKAPTPDRTERSTPIAPLPGMAYPWLAASCAARTSPSAESPSPANRLALGAEPASRPRHRGRRIHRAPPRACALGSGLAGACAGRSVHRTCRTDCRSAGRDPDRGGHPRSRYGRGGRRRVRMHRPPCGPDQCRGDRAQPSAGLRGQRHRDAQRVRCRRNCRCGARRIRQLGGGLRRRADEPAARG